MQILRRQYRLQNSLRGTTKFWDAIENQVSLLSYTEPYKAVSNKVFQYY